MDRDIVHLDPAIGSLNIGDEVISGAVARELASLFPSDFVSVLPTQISLSLDAKRKVLASEFAFVGGSNLLDPRIPVRGNWKANPAFGRVAADRVVCIGTGWTHAEMPSLRFGKLALRSLLSSTLIHSVRDSRTEGLMRRLGFDNVVNTGCATIWPLTNEFCRQVPTDPADAVVFTLTARHVTVSAEGDCALVNQLLSNYETVYFWPQARFDLAYFNSLGFDERIKVLPTNLLAYEQLLVPGDIDYVGTRLHGGLHALNHGVRTLILGVDARARVKRDDFGIPYAEYGDHESIAAFVTSKFETRVRRPGAEIDRWRGQF